MKYTVEVTRIVQQMRDVEVQANSLEEAKDAALYAAGFMDWNDGDVAFVAGRVFEEK